MIFYLFNCFRIYLPLNILLFPILKICSSLAFSITFLYSSFPFMIFSISLEILLHSSPEILLPITFHFNSILSYSGFITFIGVSINNTGFNVVNAYSNEISDQSVISKSESITVSLEEKSVSIKIFLLFA